MDIYEFIRKTYKSDLMSNIRPRIFCADGFNMSVQGSAYHYSDPRENAEKYERLEVGFPSQKENILMPHAEDPSDPTGTLYGYVPIEKIQTVIDKHGGIDVEKTFNN
jgi:hypothetical protein